MKPLFSIPDKSYVYWIYGVILTLFTLGTFEGLYEHQFLDGWDDWDIMTDTAIMAKDVSYLFSPEKIHPLRPAPDLIILIGYFLWEDNPVGYHILQIGLHLVACLLLVCTFRQLGIDLELNLISVLLFLVNVAHFRAVHWIVCISYILTLIFGLLILICYTRFLNTNKKHWLLSALLALAVAISSHPSAISIVLFCIYLAWRKNRSVFRTISLSWLLFTSALIFIALTDLASPNSLQREGVLTSLEITRLPRNLLWYMGRLISSATWLTSTTASNQQNLWEIGIGLLACIGIFALYQQKKFPAADWAIWSLLTVLPFLNNPTDRLAFGPSRHLYFSSVGSSLVLAWGIRSVVNMQKNWLSQNFRRILLGIILTLLTISSSLSLKSAEALSIYFAGRGYAFRSNEDPTYREKTTQLYERAITQAPHLVPSDIYFRLATAGFISGKSYEHILERALIQNPSSPLIQMLLGVSTFLQKNLEIRQQGEERIRNAFEITGNADWMRWNTALAFQNLAIYFHQTKRYQEAVDLYKRALKLRPNYPIALFNLGNALYSQGKTKETIFNPSNKTEVSKRGNTLYTLGHFEEAVETYKKLIQLDPNNSLAYANLGNALYSQNRLEEAIQKYRKALKISPDNPAILFNLGSALKAQKNTEKAIKVFRKVIQIKPNLLEAYRELSNIFEPAGRIEEAIWASRRLLSFAPEDSSTRTKLQELLKLPLLPK